MADRQHGHRVKHDFPWPRRERQEVRRHRQKPAQMCYDLLFQSQGANLGCTYYCRFILCKYMYSTQYSASDPDKKTAASNMLWSLMPFEVVQ